MQTRSSLEPSAQWQGGERGEGRAAVDAVENGWGPVAVSRTGDDAELCARGRGRGLPGIDIGGELFRENEDALTPGQREIGGRQTQTVGHGGNEAGTV